MKLIGDFFTNKYYNYTFLLSLFVIVPALLHYKELNIAIVFVVFGLLMFALKAIYISIVHGDEIHKKAKKASFGEPEDEDKKPQN